MALKNPLKRKNVDVDEEPAEEVTLAQAMAEDEADTANGSATKPRTPGVRWNKARDAALVEALRTVGGEDPEALVAAVNGSEAFAGAPARTLQHIRSRRNYLQENAFKPKGMTLPEIKVKRTAYVPPVDELVSLFQGVSA